MVGWPEVNLGLPVSATFLAKTVLYKASSTSRDDGYSHYPIETLSQALFNQCKHVSLILLCILMGFNTSKVPQCWLG